MRKTTTALGEYLASLHQERDTRGDTGLETSIVRAKTVLVTAFREVRK